MKDDRKSAFTEEERRQMSEQLTRLAHTHDPIDDLDCTVGSYAFAKYQREQREKAAAAAALAAEKAKQTR